ncbi:ketopantoate reductase family protein [Flocculibacter collagenilyticus]|uniref:ketopantoate reductase family protein n=1 Tax=Flocculibacter collagenilyticus TaxID=2744479 RepID=UPI0018F33DBF|nr:2-dehydropantoate 2-reductase [Flocculibacter collagenilyticus]
MTYQLDDKNHNSWHIIGNGAVGNLWAYHLHQAGAKVHLLTKKVLEGSQFQFIDLKNQHHEFSIKNLAIPSLKKGADDLIQNLIIPTKAYDAVNAFMLVQPWLSANSTIVLSHNGMGTVEKISKLISNKQTLLIASTSHGALKPSPHCIQHTGLGTTFIGCAHLTSYHKSRAQLITHCLNDAMPTVHFEEDLACILWRKLAINAVINPLTAINDIKNGELEHESFSTIKSAIIDEWYQAASAEGVTISLKETRAAVEEVIKLTAANSSSMRQDIKLQRNTEIAFINGYIVSMGKKHGIHTPTNQYLLDEVLKLSRQN